MATQDDLSTVAAIYKTLYPQDKIKNEVYMKNPMFGLMPKDEKFDGASSTEPLIYGTSQNRSGTFSQSNLFLTTDLTKAFILTRVPNYAQVAISNEGMLASKSNEGAFLDLLKMAMDNALLSLSRSICVQMYRSGTGSVAQIASTATINSSSTAVQLSVPSDVTNLEPGMNLAFSATDGGSLRAYASSTAFIVQIDRINGTFLCSSSFNGSAAALSSLITSVAVGDYIYQNPGDLNVMLSGLKAWLPGSNVTSSSFFSVNRTSDVTRLAGIYFNGSAFSLDEALVRAATYVSREGGNPTHCFINYVDYNNLVNILGSRGIQTQYITERVTEPGVTVGYNSLLLVGAGTGAIKVIADQNCPQGTAFILDMSTWKLKTLGPAVNIFKGDSLTVIRDTNVDNLNLRIFSYGQMSCRAPGWNAQVLLPTASS